MKHSAPRFWLPLGQEIPVIDNGFMPDPTDWWAGAYVPEAKALDALAEVPCLILIGEPGLGKTTSMRAEYERVRGGITGIDRALWMPLGQTRDPELLRRSIFGSVEFTTWRDGPGTLHLFLDSLDEARLRIEHVAQILLAGLDEEPFSRLKLRLSCRSANRHQGLEDELRQRFGPENFEVRELAPLLKRDVVTAATASGLRGEAFVGEVIERSLQPLAMVPESLNFLLDAAENTGSAPASRIDAFEQGLQLLARERDEDRRDPQAGGRLTPTGRLAICARVASALLLSGRSAVRIDDRQPGLDDAALPQLSGGQERDQGTAIPTSIEVTQDALRESLGTGVLTAAGNGRLAFAQASYAEFLTARWLAGGGLTQAQRRGLLFFDIGGRLRVVPQLREIAVWLAGISAEFHRELLENDPGVLLRADPAGLDDAERERLIEALFAGVRSMELDRWDRRIRAGYPKLRHRALVTQLRSVVLDTSEDTRVRQVACDIVGACALGELAGEFADLALDSDCDLHVRIAATTALESIGEPREGERISTLATEPLPEDEEDELKGAALRVVWPDALSASKLLASLRQPKRKNLLGLYKSFLFSNVVEHLDTPDLPMALAWAAKLPVEHYPTDALSDLRDELLAKAWPLLTHDERVLDAYVETVVPLLCGRVEMLSRLAREKHPEAFTERAGRRRLLARLIPFVTDDELPFTAIVFSTPPLLKADDMDWLIEQLEAAVGGEREEALARLVDGMLVLGGSEQRLLEARELSPALREMTAGRYDAVVIDSPKADEARRRHAERLAMDREESPAEDEVDIPGGVHEALDLFDDGNTDGFWIATRWLELDPDNRQQRVDVSDLRALPGWSLIDDAERDRVLAAARSYVTAAPLRCTTWFDRHSIHWPAWAAYRGLRLLRDIDPDALESLGNEVWGRWAPVIVAWPRYGSEETGEVAFNDWAIESLMSRAPEAGAGWLGKRLDREVREPYRPTALDRFGHVWRPDLEALVLKRATRSRLDPEKRTELLRFLIGNGSRAALAHARRLVVPGALKAGGRRQGLAVRVAAMLAAERPHREWERIWRLMLRYDEFGRALVERLAADETHIGVNVSAAEAAALYEWVLERYPVEEDPRDDEAHNVTPREQIGDWRNRILNVLASQGTREAVLALGRLASEHPDMIGIRYLKRQAEDLLERAEWDPPSPEQVIQLSDDANRRYVRSARDLKQVVLSSLERAQTALTGQRPQAALLWDAGTVRPKPERLIAAWLEDHLRTDLSGRGVFLGREVEIRAHPKGHMGESVDIMVEAVAGERVAGSPTVSVTIELKCCWHADLDKAMSAQLVDRYLDPKNNQGIYLVAYFDSPSWADEDARNRRACRRRNFEDFPGPLRRAGTRGQHEGPGRRKRLRARLQPACVN
jgi:hypothetical protein